MVDCVRRRFECGRAGSCFEKGGRADEATCSVLEEVYSRMEDRGGKSVEEWSGGLLRASAVLW
jgi:hypothetical protein